MDYFTTNTFCLSYLLYTILVLNAPTLCQNTTKKSATVPGVSATLPSYKTSKISSLISSSFAVRNSSLISSTSNLVTLTTGGIASNIPLMNSSVVSIEIGLQSSVSLSLPTEMISSTSIRTGTSIGNGTSVRTGTPVRTGVPVRTGTFIRTSTSIETGTSIGAGTSVRTGTPVRTGTFIRTSTSIETGTSIGTGTSVGTGTSIRTGTPVGTGTSIRTSTSVKTSTLVGTVTSIGTVASIDSSSRGYSVKPYISTLNKHLITVLSTLTTPLHSIRSSMGNISKMSTTDVFSSNHFTATSSNVTPSIFNTRISISNTSKSRLQEGSTITKNVSSISLNTVLPTNLDTSVPIISSTLLSTSPSYTIVIVSTYVPCFVTYTWNSSVLNTSSFSVVPTPTISRNHSSMYSTTRKSIKSLTSMGINFTTTMPLDRSKATSFKKSSESSALLSVLPSRTMADSSLGQSKTTFLTSSAYHSSLLAIKPSTVEDSFIISSSLSRKSSDNQTVQRRSTIAQSSSHELKTSVLSFGTERRRRAIDSNNSLSNDSVLLNVTQSTNLSDVLSTSVKPSFTTFTMSTTMQTKLLSTYKSLLTLSNHNSTLSNHPSTSKAQSIVANFSLTSMSTRKFSTNSNFTLYSNTSGATSIFPQSQNSSVLSTTSNIFFTTAVENSSNLSEFIAVTETYLGSSFISTLVNTRVVITSTPNTGLSNILSTAAVKSSFSKVTTVIKTNIESGIISMPVTTRSFITNTSNTVLLKNTSTSMPTSLVKNLSSKIIATSLVKNLSSTISPTSLSNIAVHTSTLSLCLSIYSTLVPVFTTKLFPSSSMSGIASKITHFTSTHSPSEHTVVIGVVTTQHLSAYTQTYPYSSLYTKGNVPHTNVQSLLTSFTPSHSVVSSILMLSNSTFHTEITSLRRTTETQTSRNKETTITKVFNSLSTSYVYKSSEIVVYSTRTLSTGDRLSSLTVRTVKSMFTIFSSQLTTKLTTYESLSTPSIQPTRSSSQSREIHTFSFSVAPSKSMTVASTTPVTTAEPETTAKPVNNNLKIVINVHPSVDVTTRAFQSGLEKKLVDTYVSLKSIRKRRAVSNGDATVNIINVARNGGTNVDVEFSVQENGIVVPAGDAAKVFNYLSESGLQKRLGYNVIGPVTSVAPSKPYTLQDVLGMVVEENANTNMTNSSVQAEFRRQLAEFYKIGRNIAAQVEVTIIFSKRELGGIYYLEMYFTVNGSVQNATHVASFFNSTSLNSVDAAVNVKAGSLPYVVNTRFLTIRENVVRMTIKPLVKQDVTTSAYQQFIELKISEIFMLGKHKNRRRRAVSSVVTQVSLIMPVNTDQAEVTFVTADQGEVQSGQKTADTMNRLSAAEMQAVLGAEVVSKPAPLVTVIPVSTSEPPYWIIAAATAPVVLIALLCCLVCWRWKRGGPKPTPEEVEMVDRTAKPEASPRDVVEIEETKIISEKKEMTIPLHATNNNIPRHNDELKTSTRRKVRGFNKSYGRQNRAYEGESEQEDDIEEEAEEVEESEEETEDEEEVIIVRKSPAQQKHRHHHQDIEVKRKLDYENKIRRTPPQKPPRTPIPASRPHERQPLELTGSTMEDDEFIKPVHVQNLSYSAGHVPTFGNMTESKGLTSNTPVRFRTNIENMEEFTKPTGPLPLLDFKQTSLIAAAPVTLDPDLQHKAEVERLRNKQRQRDHMVSTAFSTSTRNSKPPENRWQREQDEIDAVLDPANAKTISNASTRKGRIRKRLRRKNKIYMAPTEGAQKKEDVLLKSFQQFSSPQKESVQSPEDDAESDAESELSMRETSRRIHALLDDTFTTLKKYQKHLPKEESSGKPKLESDTSFRSSTPRRYAGMPPALPEPPPAHGRATAAPSGFGKRREVASNPYANPYNQYPVLAEPMVTWDPLERQRYINQRFGYPVYGPTANTLTMPYGMPGQNVYMTPLQQRPDGMGGTVWSPYANENITANPAFNHTAMGLPGQNSLPRNLRDDDFKLAHTTTLDMDDFGESKKSNSQPLIRAIKEELLKLSQNAQGKTKIQALQQASVAPNS
ncbi:uncharacterized protein LOC130662415 isoform X2 [Hydractinia symbiolongicarpus]|uniref:uncharacterized protein LOC130662415 isoform X2 n=1 Tax=Hydractinia symbiolongicarpus TaxID=13093 RepID=UPI00254FD636|nr:uncharacterized protein LOC130662415 isoform X2 [Hydractinia symbiolongicarpus]